MSPESSAPPVEAGADPQRQGAPFLGWGWAAGYTVAPPLPRPDQSWAVFRGTGERITDLDLARLVGDEALATQIRTSRDRKRLLWAVGFGAAAAMSLAAGASLASEPDTRTPGLGLLGFAAVSGGLSLLFPLVGGAHALSLEQASTLVESYNRDLRARLGLE